MFFKALFRFLSSFFSSLGFFIMPQPLSSFTPRGNSAEVNFSPASLHTRPELAAEVMETISNWSYVDLEMSRIMTKLLKADFEAVAEMLISLTSADARRAVIRAAAAVALTEDDLRLYDATLKVIKPSRDRRNQYAHHLWGTYDALPDALLLIDPRYLAREHAQVENQWRYALASELAEQESSLAFKLDPKKIMVYRPADIDRDLNDSMRALIHAINLRVALEGGPKASESRQELLGVPQIQQLLLRHSNGTET